MEKRGEAGERGEERGREGKTEGGGGNWGGGDERRGYKTEALWGWGLGWVEERELEGGQKRGFLKHHTCLLVFTEKMSHAARLPASVLLVGATSFFPSHLYIFRFVIRVNLRGDLLPP